jgi:hypothetical protein
MAKSSRPSLEEIAAEVGRLFGTTEAHARKWLQQRDTLLEALRLVRTNATRLIEEIGGSRRSPRDIGDFLKQPGQPPNRPKRRLSAATIAKMRAAAKRRWAERKKAKPPTNA